MTNMVINSAILILGVCIGLPVGLKLGFKRGDVAGSRRGFARGIQVSRNAVGRIYDATR